MPFEHDSAGVELDPIKVEGDLLAVDRTFVARESGIIADIRIASHADSPVKYRVIDPFPSAFDVEEIGFHPDYEPSHGRIDNSQIIIGGVVDHDDDHLVKYGMCPFQARPPEELARVQREHPPVIDLEERVDAHSVDEIDLETPTFARGTSSADRSSSGIYSSFKRSVLGETNSDDTEPTGSAEAPETAPTTSEEAAEAVADAISDLEAINDVTDSASADPETVEELFEHAESGSETDADPPAVPPREDKQVVDQLLDELRDESASAERREALAEELTALLNTQEPILPQSAAVRLRELESKMAELSAYREALRDLIDEHGTAEEFVTEIKSSIATVETTIEDLRDDLESTTADLEVIDANQEELADDLEDLDSSLEALAADSTAGRDDLADDIDSLEDTVDDLRDTVGDARTELAAEIDHLTSSIEQVEADIDTLGDDVEEGKARRRAIAKALSGDQIDEE